MNFIGQALIDAILLGGIYTLMVMGLALSFGVIRIINFMHGEAIMLGAYGAYWAFALYGVDPLLVLPLLMMLGAAAGYVLFKTTIAPVLNAPHENQILLTFGLGLILTNVALILWTGNERSSNPPYTFASLNFGDIVVPVSRLLGFSTAAVLIGAMFIWLKYGELGRASRAIAQDRDAATLMGINVPHMYAFSFGVSTALAVASGAICSFIFAVTPFMGFDMLVKGFAIVILGGVGSVIGAVAGSFLLAFAETAVAYYVPNGNGWSEAVAFGVLFLTLLIRPYGIAGRPAAG